MTTSIGSVVTQVQAPVQQSPNQPAQNSIEPSFCERLTENVRWAWNASLEKLVGFGSVLRQMIEKVVAAVGDFFAPAVDWVKEKIYGPVQLASIGSSKTASPDTRSVTEETFRLSSDHEAIQQSQTADFAENRLTIVETEDGGSDASGGVGADNEANEAVVLDANVARPPGNGDEAIVSQPQSQEVGEQQPNRGFWSKVPIINWFF